MELRQAVEEIKNSINSEQIKNKIISDRGLVLKSGKCCCFVHNESNPSMSFDHKNKRFKCFSCGASVDIFEHYQSYYNIPFVEAIRAIVRDFNLSIDINIKESKIKPKKEAKPKIYEKLIQSHFEYLAKRGLSLKTIEYLDLKSDTKINGIVFPYSNECGEHIANKYRLSDVTPGPKMKFQYGTNANTLFNMDKVDITKPLVICEGEIDCASLIECGIYNAVSVPTGVHSTEWIKVNWEWLEQFKEIIIWFDNDDAGIKGSREIMNRLSNDVVKIARCEREISDINELLNKEGKESVLKILEEAIIPLIEGVTTLDLVEDFNVYEADKIKFGIEGFDKTVLGTLFGTLTVLTGVNGHGKSTIVNQLYVGEPLFQGYKTFMFSGELEASNIKEWLLTTLAPKDAFRSYISKSGVQYKKINPITKENMLRKMKDKFFLYFDDENYSLDSILNIMTKLAKQQGVKVFVIDNLMVVEDEQRDEYKSQTNIVKKLKSFAKKYNAAVVLVAHPRKTLGELGKMDVAGSSNITNLADYVLKVERIFEENGSDKYTVLEILKNRPTGKNIKTKLKFDNDRKRFYNIDPITEEPNFVMLEKDYLEDNSIQDEFEFIDGEF